MTRGGQIIRWSEKICATLRACIDGHPPIVIGDKKLIGYKYASDNIKHGRVASTMRAKDYKEDNDLLVESMRARRLTPRECERLQGLPDDWTKGVSDSARYRMIGNGMAQPCADFVIEKVVEALSE